MTRFRFNLIEMKKTFGYILVLAGIVLAILFVMGIGAQQDKFTELISVEFSPYNVGRVIGYVAFWLLNLVLIFLALKNGIRMIKQNETIAE